MIPAWSWELDPRPHTCQADTFTPERAPPPVMCVNLRGSLLKGISTEVKLLFKCYLSIDVRVWSGPTRHVQRSEDGWR